MGISSMSWRKDEAGRGGFWRDLHVFVRVTIIIIVMLLRVSRFVPAIGTRRADQRLPIHICGVIELPTEIGHKRFHFFR